MKAVLLVQLLCLLGHAAKHPVTTKKSKLCGNEKCDQVLFKAKVKRVMTSTHEAFLSVSEGVLIDVTAIKYSDRTDLMEGVLADGTRGNFYIGAIDMGSYVEFLRNAIVEKKELKEISQDRADLGEKRILGTIRADVDLVRDYNVQAKNYAKEHKLPDPELFPLPEVTNSGSGHHGHSHSGGGHGHSHSHEAGAHSAHSHGAAHSHVHPQGVAALPTHTHETVQPKVDQATTVGNEVHEQKTAVPVEVLQPEIVMSTTAPPAAVNIPPPTPVNVLTTPPPTPVNVVPVTLAPVPVSAPTAGPELTPSGAAHEKVPLPEMEKQIAELMARDAALVQAERQREAQEIESVDPLKMNSDANSSQTVNAAADPHPTTRLSSADIIGATTQSLNVKQQASVVPSTAAGVEPLPSTPLPVQPPSGIPVEETVTVPPPIATPVEKPSVPITPQETPSPNIEPEKQPDPPKAPHEVPEATTALPSVDISTPPSQLPTTLAPESHLDDSIAITKDPVTGVEYCERDGGCPVGSETIPPDPKPITIEELNASVEKPAHDEMSAKENMTFPVKHINLTALASSGVFNIVLSSVSKSARNIPPFADVNDAGIGLLVNFALLIAAMIYYFISWLLSDPDEERCDWGITHDLATRCKKLEEQNRAKEAEIIRLGSSRRYSGTFEEQLKKDIIIRDKEITKLLQMLDTVRCTVHDESALRELLEVDLNTERRRTAQAEETIRELKRQLEEQERAHSRTTKELSTARESLDTLENELRREKQLREDTAIELKKTKDAVVKANKDLQAANEQVRKLSSEKNNLELENATLSSMLEEVERNRKEGSGGSGGWSDFGDDIVGEADDDKEKTPASSTITIPVAPVAGEVREVAKLRGQLKKVEQELETTRMALEYEKQERQQLESKLASLEAELERKTKEVSERERERSRADERCNELLSMMKENNMKTRETEGLRDKLRDELIALQGEFSAIIDERRKKDEKICELEMELKRMRNEHLKLETRRFNEVLELKHKLDVLQTTQMQPLAPSVQGYDFLNKHERDLAHSPLSLWEEPPRSMSSNCPTSPDDEYLFSAYPPAKKGPSRARRSDRLKMDNSPSDTEKHKERKETTHRRVRSRSHGRQLWSARKGEVPHYMTMDPSYHQHHTSHPNVGADVDPHSLRHNRSVNVYYSSGGSNGGRSPPPEMPLLSAIPPPGLKKPSGKRVVDQAMEFKSS